MSLEKLTKSHFTDLPSHSSERTKTRSFAWMLPWFLLLGFAGVTALLFGERLLPAEEVRVAPVVTIRTPEAVPQETRGGSEIVLSSERPSRGKLLFQASGWVEPDPYLTYVPTLINGVVREVFALDGETVKKGDLVATLVDEDFVLDLESAERAVRELEKQITAHCVGFDIVDAEIEAAKQEVEAERVAVEDARVNKERLAKLNSGAVSKQDVIQSELAFARKEAELAAAKAEISRLIARREQLDAERSMMNARLATLETNRDRAELALSRTKIVAPMDGIVLETHAVPGAKRMLTMDDPKSAVILELYDPAKLQARIDVPLNEASALAIGQEVELSSDLLNDRVFSGSVTRITGRADLQRNTLQAKVEIHDPDARLRPDMLVRAKFFQEVGGENVSKRGGDSDGRLSLYVPETALTGTDSLWVVSPRGTATKRSVLTGEDRRDGHIRILEGVFSGESVILPPHDGLEEGQRVKLLTQ